MKTKGQFHTNLICASVTNIKTIFIAGIPAFAGIEIIYEFGSGVKLFFQIKSGLWIFEQFRITFLSDLAFEDLGTDAFWPEF